MLFGVASTCPQEAVAKKLSGRKKENVVHARQFINSPSAQGGIPSYGGNSHPTAWGSIAPPVRCIGDEPKQESARQRVIFGFVPIRYIAAVARRRSAVELRFSAW